MVQSVRRCMAHTNRQSSDFTIRLVSSSNSRDAAASASFPVNRMPGGQSPLAVQIARVEVALNQNRIVRPDQATGCEVGALELERHHAVFRDLIRVIGQ